MYVNLRHCSTHGNLAVYGFGSCVYGRVIDDENLSVTIDECGRTYLLEDAVLPRVDHARL